jgi:hypothetical protein
MAQYSSSRVTSATVASTSKTTVATINIPSNENWLVYAIWGSHPQSGLFSLDIDQLPGGNFSFMMNSSTIGLTADDPPHSVAIPINGPATLKTEVTPDAATSGTARVMVMYNVTTRGA